MLNVCYIMCFMVHYMVCYISYVVCYMMYYMKCYMAVVLPYFCLVCYSGFTWCDMLCDSSAIGCVTLVFLGALH